MHQAAGTKLPPSNLRDNSCLCVGLARTNFAAIAAEQCCTRKARKTICRIDGTTATHNQTVASAFASLERRRHRYHRCWCRNNSRCSASCSGKRRGVEPADVGGGSPPTGQTKERLLVAGRKSSTLSERAFTRYFCLHETRRRTPYPYYTCIKKFN